jgi:hypothetical protein
LSESRGSQHGAAHAGPFQPCQSVRCFPAE